jgi:hypothetical protein
MGVFLGERSLQLIPFPSLYLFELSSHFFQQAVLMLKLSLKLFLGELAELERPCQFGVVEAVPFPIDFQ